jgi:DnaJ-class molecular chaperone
MVELVVLVLVVVGGWLVSLWFNPWVKCSKCQNKPKIKGWIYSDAHHICDKCGGTGQQLRVGRKQFFGQP